MTELYRIIRHGFAPVVAWLVASGYLPEYAKGDVIEFFALGGSFALPYLVSWWRDKRK